MVPLTNNPPEGETRYWAPSAPDERLSRTWGACWSAGMCPGHEVLAAIDSSWRPRSGRVPRKRPGRKSGFGRHSGEVVPIGAQLAENAGVGFALSPTPTSFRGGSGRPPPPGLASHAARLNHRGAERRTHARRSRVEAAGRQVGATLDRLPGTTSAPRQVAEHATRGERVLPPRGPGPPGSSVKTLLSALGFEQTVPSDCWSRSEGWAASLGS